MILAYQHMPCTLDLLCYNISYDAQKNKISFELECKPLKQYVAKTISPLWFYKTIQKPIGKSAKALKL